MISKVTIENLTTNEKIELGVDTEEYLIDESSIDWGTASVTHNSYEYPNQIGKQIVSTNIDTRDISISGYIISNDFDRYGLTFNQIWEKSLKSIEEKKMKLARIFNPLDVIRININDYYIDGNASASISFGKTYSTNNEVMCQFLVPVFCPEPLFKYKANLNTVLSGTQALFHFPLIFKVKDGKEEGIMFGIRKSYQIVAVENSGSVEVGADFILQALGTVINPQIENMETGEKFKINKTLEAGEIVIVSTREGNKKVTGIIGTKEENYFKYWSIGSKYLKLKPGKNLFGYTSDEESWKLLDISVEMSPEVYAFPSQ